MSFTFPSNAKDPIDYLSAISDGLTQRAITMCQRRLRQLRRT